MSPISGRLFDKFGAKPLALIGLIFIIPALWGVTDLSETTSYSYLLIRTIVLRIGISFLTMPINAAGLNALPKQLNAHGSAVTNTVRQVAGAIGTALVVTVMTTSTTNHVEKLMQAGGVLSKSQIIKESSIIGASDAYMFTLIIAILAFLVTLTMPNRKAGIQETTTTNHQPDTSTAEGQ